MFIDRLSASKSDTIDQCLYKYDCRYNRRLPGFPSKNEDALDFGTYIHRIFELGYTESHLGSLQKLAENIKKDYKVPLIYEKTINQCLTNFLKFNAGLGQTLAVEHEFSVDLAPGIKYNGFIDRIVQGTNGGILVIDYKTSKREKSKNELSNDKQGKGYVFAVSKEYKLPIKDIHFAHYYPLSDNLVPVKFSQAAINEWAVREINKVWNIRKKKKDDFPPMQNTFCNWCEFQPMCPSFHPEDIVKTRLNEQLELKAAKDLAKAQEKEDLPKISG